MSIYYFRINFTSILNPTRCCRSFSISIISTCIDLPSSCRPVDYSIYFTDGNNANRSKHVQIRHQLDQFTLTNSPKGQSGFYCFYNDVYSILKHNCELKRLYRSSILIFFNNSVLQSVSESLEILEQVQR